jgi:hypothetical protein
LAGANLEFKKTSFSSDDSLFYAPITKANLVTRYSSLPINY